MAQAESPEQIRREHLEAKKTHIIAFMKRIVNPALSQNLGAPVIEIPLNRYWDKQEVRGLRAPIILPNMYLYPVRDYINEAIAIIQEGGHWLARVIWRKKWWQFRKRPFLEITPAPVPLDKINLVVKV